MEKNMKKDKANWIDRIEGNRIILHDTFPKEHRELKTVEIITPHKTHTYKIKKTKRGKYLFN